MFICTEKSNNVVTLSQLILFQWPGRELSISAVCLHHTLLALVNMNTSLTLDSHICTVSVLVICKQDELSGDDKSVFQPTLWDNTIQMPVAVSFRGQA